MSAPVFFATREALVNGGSDVAVLDGPDGRHAVSVRRLGVGESIVLTDGCGLLVRGTVASITSSTSLTVHVDERREEPAPEPRLVVVQAIPKGERGELAVSLLTEVGVDVIVPWSASRCVAQWRGDRGQKSWTKWVSTARESGKQSRRLWWPDVRQVASTADVNALIAGASAATVLHEEAEAPLAGWAMPVAGDVVLVVGPEGGIAPDELEAFTRAGAAPLHLGPSVMRTSTAGAAAASVLLAASGRWSR
jgi:16S rRNA (uracil1498-N3)-methyltransferase